MTFCNNNNLLSSLPCPDWMQKPLQISEGGSPNLSCGAFQSSGHQPCKFIGTKESFKWQKCSSPTGKVWCTKMTIVSSFWDTKGAFDWEIRIRISDLKSNAKSENGFNAEISVFGFPFYRSLRK